METIVLVIGGSFAGLAAIRKLQAQKFLQIILVEPKEFFEYTPGLHHVLGGKSTAETILTPLSSVLGDNVKLFQEKVSEITDERVAILESGTHIKFDYCIMATGSTYPFPIYTKKAMSLNARRQELIEEQESVKKGKVIICVGAGLVGVEMASEIKSTYPEKRVYLLDLLPEVLSSINYEKASAKAKVALESMGVELRLGQKSKIEAGEIIFESGEIVKYDKLFWCCGMRANTSCLKSAKQTQLGISIEKCLQSSKKNVFICGDCMDGSTAGALKTAYTAEETGSLVAENVLRTINNMPLLEYPKDIYGVDSAPVLVIVSLGLYNSIMVSPTGVFEGRLFLYFKHFIQYSKIKQAQGSWWSNWVWWCGELGTAWMHYSVENMGDVYKLFCRMSEKELGEISEVRRKDESEIERLLDGDNETVVESLLEKDKEMDI